MANLRGVLETTHTLMHAIKTVKQLLGLMCNLRLHILSPPANTVLQHKRVSIAHPPCTNQSTAPHSGGMIELTFSRSTRAPGSTVGLAGLALVRYCTTGSTTRMSISALTFSWYHTAAGVRVTTGSPPNHPAGGTDNIFPLNQSTAYQIFLREQLLGPCKGVALCSSLAPHKQSADCAQCSIAEQRQRLLQPPHQTRPQNHGGYT